MPTLAWRDDADGFAFSNSWALDDSERAVLVSLVRLIFPAVVPIITSSSQ